MHMRVIMPGNNPTADQVDENGHLRSMVVKRSLLVGGHRTSVSLEGAFWDELRAIARERNVSVSQLVGRIDRDREHANLSSAIRVFVFEHHRNLHPAGSGIDVQKKSCQIECARWRTPSLSR